MMSSRPDNQRALVDVKVALSILAVLLFLFQYLSLTKLKVLAPAVSYQTPQRFAEEVQRQVNIDVVDGLLFSALCLLSLFLMLIEFREKRLTLFLKYVFSNEKRTLLLFGVSSFVLVRFYFATGDLEWAGDVPQHVMYSHITARAISSEEIPFWTNYLGTGAPYLQFYGFLFFYAVGLVNLLCDDVNVALKLSLACCHVASGLGMYCFVRRLCSSRAAGFLAGLAYVLSFWHTQHVLIMGRLPLALFYALLPWPFFCFERINNASWPFAVTVGGLTLGLLAFAHPGYALFATGFFTAYVAVRLWNQRDRDFWRPLRISAALLCAGLLFGSYLTLGLWAESSSTGFHDGHDLSAIPEPTWRHVFVWSNFRFWLLAPEEPFHW